MTRPQRPGGPLAPRSSAGGAVTLPSALAERLRALAFDAGDLALAAELGAAINGMPVIGFDWAEPKVFVVNGHTLVARGRGLALAWLLLAGHRHRIGHLSVDAVFSGRRASAAALQTLDRAADQVRAVSPELAHYIGCFGVRGGVFVQRRQLPAIVEMRSPWLAASACRVNPA